MSQPLTVLGFASHGETFATLSRGASGGTPRVQFWRATGETACDPVGLQEAPQDWSAVAAGPAVNLIAIGHGRGYVSLFDWGSGVFVRKINSQRGYVSRLLFSPDGHRVAVFQWPRQFQVFDSSSGSGLGRWAVVDSEVGPFVFSPDGRLLAVGGTDNQVTVWDSVSGERVAALRGHKAEIKALAFSPDGRTLASSSTSLTLKLWHVPTWRELATLADGPLITFLAFADDGVTLWAGEHRKGLHRFTAPRPVIAAEAQRQP